MLVLTSPRSRALHRSSQKRCPSCGLDLLCLCRLNLRIGSNIGGFSAILGGFNSSGLVIGFHVPNLLESC